MKHFLIIQTAFIGDVILATPIIESLHQSFPEVKIDFMLRKGNESLLEGHPYINVIIIWNKQNNKYRNLFKVIKNIRSRKYDCVINVQRFASTGFITALSAAKMKIGFDKNPFSLFFDHKVKHLIGSNIHETQRNLSLIEPVFKFSNFQISKLVKLFPSDEDYRYVSQYKKNRYICLAPASVWFTKQYPKDKWIDFIKQLDSSYDIYLLGGKNDYEYCNNIIKEIQNSKFKIQNLAGKLSFLQTAALMKDAGMNYVNDSAPLHLASSVNAPVTAIFCSTIPAFGFGPLSERSFIVETEEMLDCRPCGLHGFKQCPLKHFNCAYNIKTKQLLKALE